MGVVRPTTSSKTIRHCPFNKCPMTLEQRREPVLWNILCQLCLAVTRKKQRHKRWVARLLRRAAKLGKIPPKYEPEVVLMKLEDE